MSHIELFLAAIGSQPCCSSSRRYRSPDPEEVGRE
jgi:hypothetical protein